MTSPQRADLCAAMRLRSLPQNWVVATNYKSCCSSKLSDNVNVVVDPEVSKPVLALIANNVDIGCEDADVGTNGTVGSCHKLVPCRICTAAVVAARLQPCFWCVRVTR